MQKVILYDKIYVFKNAFKETDQFIKEIKESQNTFNSWQDWYGMHFSEKDPIGKYSSLTDYKNFVSKTFPTKDEWNEVYKSSSNEWSKKISNIFYDTTSQYVLENNIHMPQWDHSLQEILIYFPNSSKDFAMSYHNDYRESDESTYCYYLTCNLYINDNYEDGEIKFFISDTKERIDYKPSAGDMLIFPSAYPYLHAVNNPKNYEKIFIRMFWGYKK